MRPPRWSLTFLAAAALLATAVRGQEFRIDTDIFVGDEKEPGLQNLTLFKGNVVYDFLLTGSQEIVVFDQSRSRFVLMDPRQKIKTTLTTDDILKFTAEIKVRGDQSEQAEIFNTDFNTEFDEETSLITVSNDRLSYRAHGVKPKLPDAAETYRQFADWYARLNATRQGNLPPFARLKLNELLAQKGVIPDEIERTLTHRRLRNHVYKVRSKHLVFWRLPETDRKRIDDVDEYLARFQAVSFAEYRQKTDSAVQVSTSAK